MRLRVRLYREGSGHQTILDLAILAEFEVVLYADHVRFHSGHPYIYVDGLIIVMLNIMTSSIICVNNSLHRSSE